MKRTHKIKRYKQNKTLDKFTYLSGLLLPVMTLPQVYDIWVSGKTDGVSALTWGLYTGVSLLFLTFGLRHREKLLVSTYLPMFAVEVLLVGGLIIKQ